jgi:hypothetical protein
MADFICSAATKATTSARRNAVLKDHVALEDSKAGQSACSRVRKNHSRGQATCGSGKTMS